MAWGIPPKFDLIKELNTSDVALINNNLTSILKKKEFLIESIQTHNIQVKKKLSHTVLSVLSFGRPYIHLSVLISDKGRLTINSRYDYNSFTGSTFFDSGKQKKIVLPIVEQLMTQLNATTA